MQPISATIMDERKGTFCIIHREGLKIDDDHLISPQSFDYWATLLEAAEIRKHETLLKIATNIREGEVPEIFYHRKCRSAFTIKRDLESFKIKRPWKRKSAKMKLHLKRRGKIKGGVCIFKSRSTCLIRPSIPRHSNVKCSRYSKKRRELKK